MELISHRRELEDALGRAPADADVTAEAVLVYGNSRDDVERGLDELRRTMRYNDIPEYAVGDHRVEQWHENRKRFLPVEGLLPLDDLWDVQLVVRAHVRDVFDRRPVHEAIAGLNRPLVEATARWAETVAADNSDAAAIADALRGLAQVTDVDVYRPTPFRRWRLEYTLAGERSDTSLDGPDWP